MSKQQEISEENQGSTHTQTSSWDISIELAEKLNPNMQEEAKGILKESLELGKYLLNRDSVVRETTKQWNEFCINICASEDDVKSFHTLLAILADCNAQEQWLNFTFAYINDPQEPKKTLTELLKNFKQVNLERVQQTNGCIQNLGRQIPSWEKPNEFDNLYKNLQENLVIIQTNLKLSSRASNLENLLVIQQMHKIRDIFRRSAEILKHSTLYDGNVWDENGANIKAVRLSKILKPFLNLMINCKENARGWYNEETAELVNERLEKIIKLFNEKGDSELVEKELFSSTGYAPNTTLLDIPSNAWKEPSTLEDINIAIQQNCLKFLSRDTVRLNKIIETRLPPVVQELNARISPGTSLSAVYKRIDVPTIITVDKGKLLISKSLPLRAHSAAIEIEYDLTADNTLVKYDLFRTDENKRGQQIAIANKIAFLEAGYSFSKEPDVKDDKMSLEVAVSDCEQAQFVAQQIAESNKLATALGYSAEGYVDISIGRNLVTTSLTRLDSLYNQKPNEVNGLYCFPSVPINYAEFRTMREHNPNRAYFIAHYQPEFKNLAGANLSAQEILKTYDANIVKADLLVSNSSQIECLFKAGLSLQELLDICDSHPDRANFLMNNAAAIGDLAKANLSPQELLKIYSTNLKEADLLVENSIAIRNLAEINLSAQELLKIHETDRKKANFLIYNSTQDKELLDMYDTDPERANFLANNNIDLKKLVQSNLSDQELLVRLQRTKERYIDHYDRENNYSNMEGIQRLTKLGLSAEEWSQIYDENPPKAKFLIHYSISEGEEILEELSKAGLSVNRLLEIYDANRTKAKYFVDNMYFLLSLTEVGFSINQLSELYDTNRTKAMYFASNGRYIQTLSEVGLSTDKLSQIYDTNYTKAKCFAENARDIKSLSEIDLSVDQLLKKYDENPIKAKYFITHGQTIQRLAKIGLSLEKLSQTYDIDPIKAEYFANNSIGIKRLSEIGLPIDQLQETYYTNPKKIEFFSQFDYWGEKKISYKIDLLKELPEIYDLNPKKAEFLVEIYKLNDFREKSLMQIKGLKDCLQQELRQIYDDNPDKAEFIWEKCHEVRNLSELGLPPQELFKMYDKDPNCAKLLTSCSEGAIKSILKGGIITAQDLSSCSLEQLTQIKKGEITPEQLKESLNKGNAGTEHLSKVLKTAEEIGSAVPSKVVASGKAKWRVVSVKVKNSGTKQPSSRGGI